MLRRPSHSRRAPIRVGLDLDGTIIAYDDVFHRHAVAAFDLPPEVSARKNAIRAWLRASEHGEQGWIELQRMVYGPKIGDASIAPGLPAFLSALRSAGTQLSIISHKSRYSAALPRVDLHEAAYGWLERQGFFDANGFAIARSRVFFESSRAEKIRRIESEGCDVFVDDLEEVLRDPSFPSSVERWLYEPRGELKPRDGLRCFSEWGTLADRIETLR
ncbi:MAG: hypothetical protein JOY72_07305 [Actinobacteria bacterium]|nr:hypothetical protein [Actinomycetota bacterium]